MFIDLLSDTLAPSINSINKAFEPSKNKTVLITRKISLPKSNLFNLNEKKIKIDLTEKKPKKPKKKKEYLVFNTANLVPFLFWSPSLPDFNSIIPAPLSTSLGFNKIPQNVFFENMKQWDDFKTKIIPLEASIGYSLGTIFGPINSMYFFIPKVLTESLIAAGSISALGLFEFLTILSINSLFLTLIGSLPFALISSITIVPPILSIVIPSIPALLIASIVIPALAPANSFGGLVAYNIIVLIGTTMISQAALTALMGLYGSYIFPSKTTNPRQKY